MNRQSNRDLLVLFNQTVMSPQAIEQEVELLHTLLCNVERLDNLITAHELIDVNKYRIISNTLKLRTFFRQRQEKPFVFLNCKN
jgi:hypothetical protein